jgi:Cdc6-like AAA superfamily ATPase
VGKTSLANVAAKVLHYRDPQILTLLVICTTDDNFSSIWRRTFEQIRTVPGYKPGFSSEARARLGSLADGLGSGRVTPAQACELVSLVDEVRRVVVVFDEFDRLRDAGAPARIADTIKMLADTQARSTLVLVGVADTIDGLITEHASIDRALVQVRMPRMSEDELGQILARGLARTHLAVEPGARSTIITLSQGLPYYTHLVAKTAAKRAVTEGRSLLTAADIDAAIAEAVKRHQGSVASAYTRAVSSQRSDHLYAKVLLACALAQTDDRGFFSPGAVRTALNAVAGRSYTIAAFSRHLLQFCEPERGSVLRREGSERRFRFRFTDPLIGPFVVMRSIAAGYIGSDEAVRRSRELEPQPITDAEGTS